MSALLFLKAVLFAVLGALIWIAYRRGDLRSTRARRFDWPWKKAVIAGVGFFILGVAKLAYRRGESRIIGSLLAFIFGVAFLIAGKLLHRRAQDAKRDERHPS